MVLLDLFVYAAYAVAGAVGATLLLRLAWRVRSDLQIRRAKPRLLRATRHRLWRDPGRLTEDDLRFGPGGRDGAPVPPYAFVQEELTGSQPCVSVRDGRDRLWRVKWGHEVRPESFAVRFAHACGYFAEVTHYVSEGTIEGVAQLTRARSCVGDDCTFREARFELEDRSVRMLFGEHSWSWDDNPFVGTPQLSGLKIVVMLLSNWDAKDRRDVARGSNTAIFEHRVARFGHEARYLISDWGAAMGKWGSNVVSRGRWDPGGFEAQTAQFVTGVNDGIVEFGYVGQRTAAVAANISIEHVEWFCEHTQQLTEALLREGLLASGATEEEATRFARALMQRIEQLHDATGSGSGIGVRDPGSESRLAASQSAIRNPRSL
jgi:hypothetical protein